MDAPGATEATEDSLRISPTMEASAEQIVHSPTAHRKQRTEDKRDKEDPNGEDGTTEGTVTEEESEDDEEEEEEEEEEEPRLKYTYMTKHLGAVYRNGDATSSFLAAGDKMVCYFEYFQASPDAKNFFR